VVIYFHLFPQHESPASVDKDRLPDSIEIQLNKKISSSPVVGGDLGGGGVKQVHPHPNLPPSQGEGDESG
jgi:hypothetical protein